LQYGEEDFFWWEGLRQPVLQMQGPLRSSWWTSLAGKTGPCARSTSLPASQPSWAWLAGLGGLRLTLKTLWWRWRWSRTHWTSSPWCRRWRITSYKTIFTLGPWAFAVVYPFWPCSLRFGAKNVVYFHRKWGELVSRISAPICFSRIFLPVSWQIFSLTTNRFQRSAFTVSYKEKSCASLQIFTILELSIFEPAMVPFYPWYTVLIRVKMASSILHTSIGLCGPCIVFYKFWKTYGARKKDEYSRVQPVNK